MIPDFHDEDQRYQYDLNATDVVFDIGGYEGRWASEMHKRHGVRCLIVEPVKRFYRNICETILSKHSADIMALNVGIGAEAVTRKFRIKGDMTGQFADDGPEEEVAIIPFESLFHFSEGYFGIFKSKEVAVVKLNCEGGEFEILESAAPELLKRCRNIQVQWHAVVPDYQARFDALQEKLSQTHALTFDGQWVWQNWAKK